MRMGAKGKPFYRLVVKEKRSKRDGAYIENVGTYDPMVDPAEVNLKHDRIQYWIGVGAQPTETVKSLIKNNPVQTDEEKAAGIQARAEKKEADRKAREEAKRAEADRLEAERIAAEKANAEKAAAETASAAEAETAEAAPAEDGEPTPAADAPAEEAPAEEAVKAEE
ncbi:MAG TPA: 30S ribosomal protein S16 [Pyrinomonadaceae bacterium]|nr:30S ribosomal protein S16 [Pyrinomonadaceae bacterium]